MGINWFKRYKELVQDNNENYWFRRTDNGWLIPVTWQGWFSIFIFLGFFLFGAYWQFTKNSMTFVYIYAVIGLGFYALQHLKSEPINNSVDQPKIEKTSTTTLNESPNYNYDPKKILWTYARISVLLLGGFIITAVLIVIFGDSASDTGFSVIGTVILFGTFFVLVIRTNQSQSRFLKHFQQTFNPEIRVFPPSDISYFFNPYLLVKRIIFMVGISNVPQPDGEVEQYRQELIKRTNQLLYFWMLILPLHFTLSLIGFP